VNFDILNNGNDVSKKGNKRFILSEETSSRRSGPPTQDKLTRTNVFMLQKWHHVLLRDSLLDQRAQAWHSLTQPDRTNACQDQKDKKGPSVTGAGQIAYYMGTRAGTAVSSINIATVTDQVVAPSPTTMKGITPTSTTRKHVPITGIMRASSFQASMPRRNRLNPNGNGPDNFGWDSPVQGWGAGQSKLVVADSAAEAEMGRRVSYRVPSEDSRPNLSSRTGSRP
jgi:hypothetical protein